MAICTIATGSFAQEDDVYFVPSRNAKTKVPTPRAYLRQAINPLRHLPKAIGRKDAAMVIGMSTLTTVAEPMPTL